MLSVGAGMAAADTEVSETAGQTTADTLVAMVSMDRHTHLLPDRPDASRDPILSLDEFRLPSIRLS